MEKRYLKNWDYNCARLLDALRGIIENAGGRVKEFPKYEIVNRTVDQVIAELKEKIENMERANMQYGVNDAREKALKEYREKLEEAQSFDNTPLILPIYHQITFILDNVYYEYVLDDNPFFDFILWKTPISNNERCVCLGEIIDDKNWLFDSFFRFSCHDDDIKEAANMIFNLLVKHPLCKVDREQTRKEFLISIMEVGIGKSLQSLYRKERLIFKKEG